MLIAGRAMAGAMERLRPLLAGTWAGVKLYGKLDEGGFRKVVLALLVVSGATLIF